MGNYIGRTEVQDRLRRNYTALYTPKGGSAVDTDIVDADIEAAEAGVDGYLAQRYVVPITNADAIKLCKGWALTLLEELAYGSVPGREIPANVQSRVDRAHKQLEKAATGDLSLGAPTVPDERSDATGVIIVEGNTPEMERADLDGW